VPFTSTLGSTQSEANSEKFVPERSFFDHSNYVDLGLIAQGAFGHVRRVRDIRSSDTWAMKIMRRCLTPESQSYTRFITEIEIMTSLRHPGILFIHDHGEFDDGRHWFTMPEIRGRTFANTLDELHTGDPHDVFQSPLFYRILKSFAQFCQITAFAHEQKIVHRDLKPKNMMIADDGASFVIDWGLAKQLTPEIPLHSTNGATKIPRARTEQGEVLGTPAYMPPEQAFGDISLQSTAADVYSLGAVLYHLLAGQPPYRGTRPAVIAQIKRGPPQPLSTFVEKKRFLPENFVSLCEAAMQRKPETRIAGAKQIADNIREWLEHHS
jgi:eukaryotic-like serine/threonine-protein kinase